MIQARVRKCTGLEMHTAAAMTESEPVCSSRAAPASCAAPIDHVYLRRFTLGNMALEHEVLGLFAEQSPTYLLHLMAAETDRAWFEAAHALKGSARAIGAWEIASLAERAEAIKCLRDTEARASTVDALSAALGEARCYISTLTVGGSGPF